MKFSIVLLFLISAVFAQQKCPTIDTTCVNLNLDVKYNDYKINLIDTTKSEQYKKANMQPGLYIMFGQNKTKVIVK